jgi:hypothetical protein
MRPLSLILLAVLSSACPKSSPPPTYSDPYAQPGYYPQAGYGQQPAAQGSSALTGTFTNKGGSLTLHDSYGQVRGTLVGGGLTGNVQGSVAGGQLTGTIAMSDGTSGGFTAMVKGNELSLTMQGRQTLTFTRTSPPPAGKPAAGNTGMGIGSTVKTVVPTTTAATGPEYRDDVDGWSVRTPDVWKYTAKGMTLTFGSDAEPGTIFVKYSRGWSLAQMEQGATAYMKQLGATQLGETNSFKAKAGKAIVLEMTGSAQARLHGRAIGIVGPRGSLTIVGLTTPDRIDGLRARVDQIALSAKFVEPKPALAALIGPWWRYSKSTDRTLELCADGSFHDTNAKEGPAASGGQFGKGDGAGRWVAQGDDVEGRLHLVFNSGTIEEHDYKFKKPGGDVTFSGKVYGRNPDNAGKCK